MNEHESSTPAAFSEVAPQSARTARLGVPEFISMKSRLAAARRAGFAKTDPGFRELEFGLLALKDARQLANSRAGRDTSLLLYRASIRLLVLAAWLRRALGPADPSWPVAWARVTELPEVAAGLGAGKEPGDASWLGDVITSEQGESLLAKLSPAERERAVIGMKRLADALAMPLEAEATLVQRLVWARRLRVLSLALLVVSALGWSVATMTAKANLALRRPVTVSDADSRFAVDPALVVDGDRSNLGFHTSERANTTVTIDLGAVKSVTRVEVFNRVDCCQDRAVPLSLRLSVDGHDYATVARRGQVFDRWSIPLPAGSHARYIQLVHHKRDFFHLAEIEVY